MSDHQIFVAILTLRAEKSLKLTNISGHNTYSSSSVQSFRKISKSCFVIIFSSLFMYFFNLDDVVVGFNRLLGILCNFYVAQSESYVLYVTNFFTSTSSTPTSMTIVIYITLAPNFSNFQSHQGDEYI